MHVPVQYSRYGSDKKSKRAELARSLSNWRSRRRASEQMSCAVDGATPLFTVPMDGGPGPGSCEIRGLGTDCWRQRTGRVEVSEWLSVNVYACVGTAGQSSIADGTNDLKVEVASTASATCEEPAATTAHHRRRPRCDSGCGPAVGASCHRPLPVWSAGRVPSSAVAAHCSRQIGSPRSSNGKKKGGVQRRPTRSPAAKLTALSRC